MLDFAKITTQANVRAKRATGSTGSRVSTPDLALRSFKKSEGGYRTAFRMSKTIFKEADMDNHALGFLGRNLLIVKENSDLAVSMTGKKASKNGKGDQFSSNILEYALYKEGLMPTDNLELKEISPDFSDLVYTDTTSEDFSLEEVSMSEIPAEQAEKYGIVKVYKVIPYNLELQKARAGESTETVQNEVADAPTIEDAPVADVVDPTPDNAEVEEEQYL